MKDMAFLLLQQSAERYLRCASFGWPYTQCYSGGNLMTHAAYHQRAQP